MKHYIIEIANIRFGDIHRVRIRAKTRDEAIEKAVLNIGERIIAAWEV